jgi:hypothetical protein
MGMDMGHNMLEITGYFGVPVKINDGTVGQVIKKAFLYSTV